MSALILRAAGAKAGANVVTATINLPRVGAWTADVVASSDKALTGKVELVVQGGITFAGSVVRGAVTEGLWHVRLVAGAGGLTKAVKPKHYTSPTLRVVLRDVLGDVGEALSGTADGGVLGTQFEHWTTTSMTASKAVRWLTRRAGEPAWRHLPDGTIWMGPESWPESKVRDVALIEDDPDNAVMELSLITPELLPGTTILGRKVDSLEVIASGGGLRARAWTVD